MWDYVAGEHGAGDTLQRWLSTILIRAQVWSHVHLIKDKDSLVPSVLGSKDLVETVFSNNRVTPIYLLNVYYIGCTQGHSGGLKGLTPELTATLSMDRVKPMPASPCRSPSSS